MWTHVLRYQTLIPITTLSEVGHAVARLLIPAYWRRSRTKDKCHVRLKMRFILCSAL